jgi:hypothetical protein
MSFARTTAILIATSSLCAGLAATPAHAAVSNPAGYANAPAGGLASSPGAPSQPTTDSQLKRILEQQSRPIETPSKQVGAGSATAPVQGSGPFDDRPLSPGQGTPPRPGFGTAAGIGTGAATGPEAPAITFTDWTAADTATDTAAGSLDGVAVSLTGSELQIGITNGTFGGFAQPYFAPSIPRSDTIALASRPGYSYELRLAAPVTNPVLQIASLASRLEFPAGTAVAKLAGQATFAVSGSALIGAASGSGENSDANGTAQLKGTFTTIRFTATPTPDAPNGDGFYLQLGGRRG